MWQIMTSVSDISYIVDHLNVCFVTTSESPESLESTLATDKFFCGRAVERLLCDKSLTSTSDKFTCGTSII